MAAGYQKKKSINSYGQFFIQKYRGPHRGCNDFLGVRACAVSHFWYTFLHMDLLSDLLPYIQIFLSILLITAILLQQRGSSLGGALGGDSMGTTYYTRRGAEKWLFQGTIVLGILFALSAFAVLFLR